MPAHAPLAEVLCRPSNACDPAAVDHFQRRCTVGQETQAHRLPDVILGDGIGQRDGVVGVFNRGMRQRRLSKVNVVVVPEVVGNGRAIHDHEAVDRGQRPRVPGEMAEEGVGAEEDGCVSLVERVAQLYAKRTSEQTVIGAFSSDMRLLQESQSVSDTNSA